MLSFFLALLSTAQTDKDKLTGDWKYYLNDKSSFEFLRLNPDGTGLKCFGRTIDGKDSFFLNHITTLHITSWRIEKGKLFLDSKNKVSFTVNPEYRFELDDQNNLTMDGEHLIFYLYPSHLNREYFQRTVKYQKTTEIPPGYGVKTATCIVEERDLFSFQPIDSFTQLAKYKGFDDLIPHIVGCKHGYVYKQTYHDRPYSLTIPWSVPGWSFGFGNQNFYLRFDSDVKTEWTIVIYYDFDDRMKDFYFSEIKSGKEKQNIVRENNLEIYKIINWESKYEGKVFLPNSIIVAYYTTDVKLEDRLQKCIASFKYE